MLTATLADLFYNAADLSKINGGLTQVQYDSWSKTLDFSKTDRTDAASVSKVFVNAGDSVMLRL